MKNEVAKKHQYTQTELDLLFPCVVPYTETIENKKINRVVELRAIFSNSEKIVVHVRHFDSLRNYNKIDWRFCMRSISFSFLDAFQLYCSC